MWGNNPHRPDTSAVRVPLWVRSVQEVTGRLTHVAKILVVDDDATNRNLLVTMLGYHGHNLREARDGAEALAVLTAESPDLVITDILMPTMDGYEFVRQMRSDPKSERTPVIFYTAHYLEQEARGLAERCGVQHVISKPADPEKVLRIVDAALG